MSIIAKSIGRVRRILRRYRPRYHHVFRREGPFPPECHAQAKFSFVDGASRLPAFLLEELKANGTDRTIESDLLELHSGARLWYGMIEGHLAVVLFTRRGHQFRNWFVPLHADDMVIFRVRTYPAYRGRGLAPALMRFAMHECLQQGGTALIDCRTDNVPSIRSIEKAGFRKSTTMKPISREFALGSQH